MGFLLFLGLIGVLVWALVRNPLERPEVKAKIYQINQQWGEFIAGYHRLAKDDAERAVTERMLRDLQAQGIPVPADALPSEQAVSPQSLSAAEPAQAAGAAWTVPTATMPQQTVRPAVVIPKQPMDNTSILLYFGAFLLVAAAGLFVAFGGATGGVRTFIIAVTAALFYCVGFWLWYDRPKLKQAALTFIGIGIVLAPLAGVAAYNYVFQGSGALVWFVTSAVCLGLYAHAVAALKHPLLEYVLIGTFVSLFESSVAVLNLPAYYYGWGLAAVGLILQAVQLWRKQPLIDTSPSALSANILLPFALFLSLVMVPAHGSLQLAVALLLAAIYYGMLGWQTGGQVRAQALVAAQVLFLTAAAFFGYNVRREAPDAAVTLVVLAAAQVAALALRPNGKIARNAAVVALSSLVVAGLVGWSSAAAVFFAFVTLAVAGFTLWSRQQRSGFYASGVAAATCAALVGVYYLWEPFDSAFVATAFLWLLGVMQVAVLYAVRSGLRSLDTAIWRDWFRSMFAVTVLVGIFTVLTGNGTVMTVPAQLVAYTALSALLMVPFILHDKPSLWTTLAGLTPAVPLLFLLTQYGEYERPGLLLGVTVGALAWNIGLSLWQRTETTRAFAAALALLTPVAFGAMYPAISSATYYAGAYSVVMGLSVAARYVARRGKATVSTGISFAVGAAVAAVLALSIAPFAHDRLLSATTALSVAVAVYIAARFVERHASLMALLPVVAQIGLWSTYADGQLLPYAAVSALLAALGYYAFLRSPAGSSGFYLRQASLAMSYVPFMVYLGAAMTGAMLWVLPWTVLLASLTTLHAVWHHQQAVRESVGGFVALAVMMVLHFYGLRNVQVYAHVAALTLAVYAYWRWRRGEHATSDGYIVATLATVTVPLVFQSLGGTAGDLYGWWLLIEQVGIMLLGMVLHKKIMIQWGLWIAMAAVLYQLRHLGWAALTVLAVFLIGLAVFRLQRSDRS